MEADMKIVPFPSILECCLCTIPFDDLAKTVLRRQSIQKLLPHYSKQFAHQSMPGQHRTLQLQGQVDRSVSRTPAPFWYKRRGSILFISLNPDERMKWEKLLHFKDKCLYLIYFCVPLSSPWDNDSPLDTVTDLTSNSVVWVELVRRNAQFMRQTLTDYSHSIFPVLTLIYTF